ncbi:hypothetical protein EGW08_016403 [Elysia chlorotica]|uniref:Endonuclease/exonuclease/phosphatase domain-containing protein n=1 Tax=Elysia chlorotica TaxID=188477 RepID=A0A433T2Q7_ELYCH|nr:hypothetical protein EGW08_016403 [Elysia chlorotica]
MDKQANLKSVNSVKEVTSSKAGHVSLGRDRHVRQVAPDRHLATVRSKIKIEHSDDEIEKFYEELDNVKNNLKTQDVKIVMGDFNAKVGNKRIEDTIGPHGIGDINARGERLAPTVAATMMRIKLKKLKKPKQPPKFQYDALKKDIELKRKFNVAIENKFAVLDELTEVEQKWELMKESLKGCTEEFIPKKEGREHKKWMTPEILHLMDERRVNKNNPEKYKELNKKVKDLCNETKDFWITCECIGIQTYSNSSNSKYFHDKIKDVAGRKPSPKSGCIKSQSGQILMDIDDILNRWSQYVKELFDDMRGPPSMEEEVRNTIRKMKHNKATGPDEIPVELFDALNETCLIHFTKLLNLIYDTGQWPSDWKKSIFITLQKKPGATECENHRTISLMSHATKILLSVLMDASI